MIFSGILLGTKLTWTDLNAWKIDFPANGWYKIKKRYVNKTYNNVLFYQWRHEKLEKKYISGILSNKYDANTYSKNSITLQCIGGVL